MNSKSILKKCIQFFLCCFMGAMAQQASADKLITSGDSLVLVTNCYFYYYSVAEQYWYQAYIYNNNGNKMSTFCHPRGSTGLNLGNIVDVASNGQNGLVAIEQKGTHIDTSANNAWYSTDNGIHWYTNYPNEGSAGGCTQCFPLAPSSVYYVNGRFLAGGLDTVPWISSTSPKSPLGSKWSASTLAGRANLVGESTILAHNDKGNLIVQLHSSQVSGEELDYLWSKNSGTLWRGGIFPDAGSLGANYYDIVYAHDPANTYSETFIPLKDPVKAQAESTVCQNTPVNPTANPGVFITVGDYTNILYSIDGINFCYSTGLQNDHDISIFQVAYNNYFHQWIAVGEDGSAFYSNNGVSWNNSSMYYSSYEDFDLIAISDQGTTIATQKLDLNRDVNEGYCLYYSNDGGVTWNPSTFCQSPYSIVWHGPTKQFFLATPAPISSHIRSDVDACQLNDPPTDQSLDLLCASSDGITWHQVGLVNSANWASDLPIPLAPIKRY